MMQIQGLRRQRKDSNDDRPCWVILNPRSRELRRFSASIQEALAGEGVNLWITPNVAVDHFEVVYDEPVIPKVMVD